MTSWTQHSMIAKELHRRFHHIHLDRSLWRQQGHQYLWRLCLKAFVMSQYYSPWRKKSSRPVNPLKDRAEGHEKVCKCRMTYRHAELKLNVSVPGENLRVSITSKYVCAFIRGAHIMFCNLDELMMPLLCFLHT